MVTTSTRSIEDTWVSATWDEYVQIIENPIYQKAKGYYHNGQYRIEMTPIGNSIINYAIYLYATLKNIQLNGRDNCSYRKADLIELQPDLSFYVGENANAIDYGMGIIDLERYPSPLNCIFLFPPAPAFS
jgi:Uma2 family endonuclease